MIIFTKKIKASDGINAIDLDKIKSEIPANYKIISIEPQISITANNIVVAFICQEKATAAATNKPEAKQKKKNVAKKIIVGKV